VCQIEVADLAGLELADAYDWYEAQREGLGEEFLTELGAALLRRSKVA
jgi:hypothetical protein